MEVWAKLEEECGTWGGNKVRKLEYILGRARADGIRKLVSFGAGSSNWTSALAFHGTQQGFEVEVVVSGNEVPTDYRKLYAAVHVPVRQVGRLAFPLKVARGRLRGERDGVRHLPPGGTGREGNLGSLHAGREIAVAIAAGELPRPTKIFVATGTGGTAAGLALGAAQQGLALDVVCVRVAPLPYGTVGRARRSMRSIVPAATSGKLERDDRFFAPGYARPNEASLEATRIASIDGLRLDETYAAKAFAALVAHARADLPGPVLFLHTSPGEPPETV